jgi:sulfite reductase (NADPH) flavoprotein alpha-component
VVRQQPGGLCSGQLTALEPGQSVRAFLRRNPGFHAGGARTPLILIGAGTGVAPLAGFIRANARLRPISLSFGVRDPSSDFLYADELHTWQQDGRLAKLVLAVSRDPHPRYVQDALRAEAGEVAKAIAEGASVMVCGGRDMARGVRTVLGEIIAPLGLTFEILKDKGRYREDVY